LHHLLTRQDPRLEPPFTFAERPISKVNPHVTPAFEAVIMRCLSYDPKDRFADAKALKDALEVLLQRPGTAVFESDPNLAVPPTARSSANAATQIETPAAHTVSQVQPIWQFKCEDEIRGKATVSGKMVYVGAYVSPATATAARAFCRL
jgi:hypothetical protein